MILDTAKTYAIVGLGAACLGLSISTWVYHELYVTTDQALERQNEAIEAQNEAAEKRYKQLKTEADSLQRSYNALQKRLENQGEQGTTQIASDSKRDVAPVVVRYVSRPARCGGGGPTGSASPAPEAGAGPAGETSGVLAPAAEELTRRDRDAVEALQLAFNLCKQHGNKRSDSEQ